MTSNTPVRLKNGAEEHPASVTTTMMALNAMDPMMLYDIVTLCRDPEYAPFGDTIEKFKMLSLLDGSGRPHKSVKNIVLSACDGDGLDMALVSPIASEKCDAEGEV